MTTFPDDKIRIILNNIKSNPFEYDTERFHILIFENKKEHPSLFREFSFKTNGTFPYSDLLERIIMRGIISGCLHTCDNKMFLLCKTQNDVLYSKHMELSREDFKILSEIGEGW